MLQLPITLELIGVKRSLSMLRSTPHACEGIAGTEDIVGEGARALSEMLPKRRRVTERSGVRYCLLSE